MSTGDGQVWSAIVGGVTMYSSDKREHWLEVSVPKKQRPGMMISVKPIKEKEATYHIELFGDTHNWPLFYNRNSQNNTLAFLLCRTNRYVKPGDVRPLIEQVDELSKQFNVPYRDLDNVTYYMYLESCKWPMNKKQQWLDETRPFLDATLAAGWLLHGIDLKKGGEHNGFVKDECYFDVSKSSRGIMACQPLRKLLGSLLLFELNDLFFRREWSVKHLAPSKRIQYMKDYLGYAKFYLCTDISSFENAINKTILKKVEGRFYLKTLGKRAERYVRLISRGARSDGKMRLYTHNGVKASFEPLRGSGDYNTSLGNTLVNLCAIRAVAKQMGVNVRCLVEGDDACIAFYDECDVAKFEELFTGLGFQVKCELFHDLGECGFCGLHWHDIAGETYQYSSPIRQLRKLLTGSPYTPLRMVDYRAASIRSAVENSPQNLVLRELYRRYPGDVGVMSSTKYVVEQYPTAKSLGNSHVLVDFGPLPRLKEFARLHTAMIYGVPMDVIENWFSLETSDLIDRIVDWASCPT